MKKFLSYSLLAAAAATGMSIADTATTTPVGYVTTPLPQGFTNIGVNVHSPVAISGKFEIVNGAVLTDSDVADFSTTLTADRTYILEITAGAAVGATQDFTVRSGSTITLPSAIGAAANDTYQIRIAPTFEEVFGTTGSVFKKNNVAANADTLWVPDGAGGYIRYFQNTAGAWRNATTPGFAPNTPLVYLDGLFIEKKDPGTVDLVIAGQVKKTATATSLAQGFNYISTVYPAGVTLQNLGLENNLTGNNVAANADTVWVPNGSGGYTRYFMNGSGVWRNATTPGFAPADLALPSAVFIERKATGTVPLDLTPPASYSGL